VVCDWRGERTIALQHPGASPEEILRPAIVTAERHGGGRKHLCSLDCFHDAQAKAVEAGMLTNNRLLRTTDWQSAP
jgi:ribonuclease VapC